MAHRFNAFNDTPRGNHWMGATPSSISSSYNNNRNPDNTRHLNSNNDQKFTTDEILNFKNGHINRKERETLKGDNGPLPLISTEVLEVSKQRSLAVSVFMIIQAYKIFDLILLKSNLPVSGLLFNNSHFNFISKYFIIDSMFFYFLPIFKIPKLTFKPIIIFLQIAIMSLLTIFLSMEHDFVFITLILSKYRKVLFQKELTLTGSSVHNHQKILDSSSHFKGALTIKILPENTAMLNPLYESYCLPMDPSIIASQAGYNDNTLVSIPIRINSTEEIKLIQLEFRDFYTNQIELRNLTDNDFHKIENPSNLLKNDKNIIHANTKNDADSTEKKRSSIKYFNLPIGEIGFYQIKKIIDSKNLNLKIYQSHVVVPHCPTATIIGSGIPNRCIGDADQISIEIQGIPPLKLSYSKIVDDKVYSYVDTNLQPEFFKSPLKQSNLINTKTIFSIEDLSDLKWARSHPVKINLNSTANFDGHYTYKIDKLVDSLGNVMDFSILSDELKKNYDLSNEFDVHNTPKASMDERFNSNSPTKRDIVVNFENFKNWDKDLPLSVKVSYIEPSNTAGDKEHIKIIDLESNSLSHSFHAERPGRYILESVKSNHCSGIIIGKSVITISKPTPPSLEVNSSPILDQCVGQVGLTFDLSFTGIPPFHYSIKVFKLENEKRKLFETKRLTSPGSRNQFKYNPTVEGNYEIVFDKISNDLFRDPISLQPADGFVFKTSMRVKPSATVQLLNYRGSLNLCLNQVAKVPVNFKGEAPFNFRYDILETNSNKRTTYSIEDIKENRYELVTPDFNIGGDYILTLVSVQDISGCLVSLSEPDVRIKVRGDIPSASFNVLERNNKENEISIKQGSIVDIPLKLTGEGPFVVKYQHMDFDGRVLGTFENRFQSNYQTSLKINKEGLYRLVEMRDSSCNGEIVNSERQFKVSYLQNPTFVIQDKEQRMKKMAESIFMNEPVCQNTAKTVDILLSGSPPFILNYDLIPPSGIVVSKRIQVTTKYASLKLPNNESGEYIITIKNVFDSNYEEESVGASVSGASIKHEKIIKQIVNPLPSVEFTEQGKTFRTCSSNIDQKALLDPVNIKYLRGNGPLSVTFNIYHESTSRTDEITLNNVTSESFSYEKLYDGLKLGNHIVTIVKVVDTNGCTNDMSNMHDNGLGNFIAGSIDSSANDVNDLVNNNHIFISITDVPKIHLLDANVEYCVGDYVAYQLNGIAPFTIQYEFNDVLLKTREYSSQFVRLASEAGKIKINSIEDSTSQCIVNFTKPGMEQDSEKLSLNIHPIPSVTVSLGKYVIEDIHEGDQAEVIFSFEGTPPFSLTYVRTEETESDGNDNGRRPQVVETHKVTDIYTYQYRVVTSLQGTYKAIEISDAYCFTKNDAFFNN